MASNFDVAELALKGTCPSNEILYDDKGMPSIMVKIPKFTWADVDVGDSTDPFPAFVVRGTEIDAIYISKFQNIAQNSRLYSLGGQDPKTQINLATAQTYATNKGEGWHEITRLEWMAIALWCKKNGFLPYGNNNYGKDSRETVYKAIPTYISSSDEAAGYKTDRVATGTGPLTWSHNGEPDGIWDLNGNVWEWNTGMRMVYGEIQVMTSDGETFDNACADPDCVDSSSSSLWRAIDGTTGELIEPDGSGTTDNSLKLDYVNSVATWTAGELTNQSDTSRSTSFEKVAVDDTVSDEAILILQALGLYKVDTTSGAYESDVIYFNNGNAERSFYSGGRWNNSADAGVFALSGNYARSISFTRIGVRSAYCELPTV